MKLMVFRFRSKIFRMHAFFENVYVVCRCVCGWNMRLSLSPSYKYTLNNCIVHCLVFVSKTKKCFNGVPEAVRGGFIKDITFAKTSYQLSLLKRQWVWMKRICLWVIKNASGMPHFFARVVEGSHSL